MNIVEFKRGSIPEANGLWIELPCQPHYTLDWSNELTLAKETNQKIVWYFNLGLEDPFFPWEDELRFSALALALQQFTKEVWPHFQEQTVALSLYRGAMVDFVIYFQMLAHKLPDEAPIWLLFTIEKPIPFSNIFQKLFQEGFEHFEIALSGTELPRNGYQWNQDRIYYHSVESTTGAIFPADFQKAVRFDELLAKEPVRVVFEAQLSEQWEGLDRLLVLSDSLSIQGTRMLKGFAATGGEIIYVH